LILIPATPLFEAAWFVDEIIEKIEEDGDKYHQTVPVWANVIETAGNWKVGPFGVHPAGNLRKKDVDFQLRNYDEDEIEARRDGVFKYLTGLVYKSYDRSIHYVDAPVVTHPKRYMYRMIMDPHDRKPPAVIWVRFDEYGRRTVIREWPSIKDPQYEGRMFHKIKDAGPYTIKDLCQFWIDIERDELDIDPSRITRIIDPNFGNKINRSTGMVVHQEYSAASRAIDNLRGFSFITDVVDDLFTGHKAVKALLKPYADGDLPLVIDKSCLNVDYGLRRYSYADRTPKEEEKHGILESTRQGGQQHVKQAAKDFPDLLRYDAMVPFHWAKYREKGEEYDDYGDRPKAQNWRKRIKASRPGGAKGV